MPLGATFVAVIITVSTHPNISSTLVERAISEADAIWRPAGMTILWSRQEPDADSALSVTFGTARGPSPHRDGDEPLGWILFQLGQPLPHIYVSYANAVDLLQNARGVMRLSSNMTEVERETYLARAMGRALAHELGHYLFGSRDHTLTGLMKASHLVVDFLAYDHRAFEITAGQRALINDRCNGSHIADAESRHSSPLHR